MLARHEWANSASGAVPVVLIRGGITKADFKTAAALQRLGDENDARRDERAADPLPVPGLTPNLAGILRRPSRSRQGLMDSFFPGRGLRRPPEAVSLIPDSRKGGTGHRQKSLNRSGASSVYLTVCWMFLCPSQACSDRVSWPAFAKA